MHIVMNSHTFTQNDATGKFCMIADLELSMILAEYATEESKPLSTGFTLVFVVLSLLALVNTFSLRLPFFVNSESDKAFRSFL